MRKKYIKCPSCSGTMEHLYSIDRTDIRYCHDCQSEWRQTRQYDYVTPDDILAESYGQ